MHYFPASFLVSLRWQHRVPFFGILSSIVSVVQCVRVGWRSQVVITFTWLHTKPVGKCLRCGVGAECVVQPLYILFKVQKTT